MFCGTCIQPFEAFGAQLSLDGFPSVMCCPKCSTNVYEGEFEAMEIFKSDYYERSVTLMPMEQQALYELYISVSDDQGWEPEIDDASEICNTSIFDHVAYHVEGFAKDKSGYDMVAHLFREGV